MKFDLPEDLDLAIEALKEAAAAGSHVVTIEKQIRSLRQNRSLHKYCAITATKLNNAGYTQKKLFEKLKPGFDLPVSPGNVKSIFRSTGLKMFGKSSTAKLTTTEIQEVYRSVDEGFATLTGITTEWPSWR